MWLAPSWTFRSNALLDSVFMERRLRLSMELQPPPHDLRFESSHCGNCRWDRPSDSGATGLHQTIERPGMVENFPPISRRRCCSVDNRSGLVVLAPRDHGDGRVLQLPEAVIDYFAHWLPA